MRRAVPILLLIAITSCAPRVDVNPPALAVEIKIAQTLNIISQVCGDVLRSVQIAMPNQSDERRQIVDVVVTITKANIAARRALEAVSKFPNATPAEVVASLRPAIHSLQQSIQDGLIGIKNPDTKAKLQVWLIGISAAVTTMQAILEAQNG